MKLRIYFDTSVYCAAMDERWPERQAQTRSFLLRSASCNVVTSVLTREEMERTADGTRRAQLLLMVSGTECIEIDGEMRALALAYISAGAFSSSMGEDALHVAAAVIGQCSTLVSWNFRHLVNRRRRAMVNAVNVMRGLPTLEIIAPPEL